MKSRIDWFTPKGNFSLHHKVMLDYVSRLSVYVESYKNGEIDAGTCLRICKKILNEIDNPEFPFFAVRNFRELFSFIFYHLPEVPPHHRVLTLQSEEQRKVKWWKILSNDGIEKRKYKRIEKPFMAGLRVRQYEGHETVSTKWHKVAVKDLSAGGMLFDYNKNLELDSLLDFKIDISKYTPTINCVGKIIRIDKPIPISIFGIAIEFTEIEEHEKKIINTTIEKALE